MRVIARWLIVSLSLLCLPLAAQPINGLYQVREAVASQQPEERDGAVNRALETLVLCYGEEVRNVSRIRTHIVDPGATRSAMRTKAFPGEDPASLKGPEVVARAIVDLLTSDAPDGQFIRVNEPEKA